MTELPKPEVLLTADIELQEMGQLKILNVCQNMATIESLKPIKMILQINPNMVIYFDSPHKMNKS
jgi:hypothetical protein